MTVQEAKEILEYYYNQEWFLEKDQPAKNSLQIAIESMKELEQYRALGTPKEIKIREVSSAQLGKAYLSNLTELREYQSLGTVEELKEAMEKQVASKPLYRQGTLFKWIDTVRERGRNVNVPKWSNRDACPNCKKDVLKTNYCPNCGQALDWSEEDD